MASWHVPDLVRGLALAGAAALTLWFASVMPGTSTTLAHGLTGFFAMGYAALAARVVLCDARTTDGIITFRTRAFHPGVELVIAGMGAAFLSAMAGALIDLGVVVEGTKTPVAGLLLGALGLPMTLWRPQFVLDSTRGRLTRYPFGRALPLRKRELPLQISIVAEGYYVDQRRRVGDMIRGRTPAGTFELELVRGDDPAVVQARLNAWRQTFADFVAR